MDKLEESLVGTFQRTLDQAMDARPEFNSIVNYFPVSVPDGLGGCCIRQADADGIVKYSAHYLGQRSDGKLSLFEGEDLDLELDPREDENLEQIRERLGCFVEAGPRGLALGIRQLLASLIACGVPAEVLHDEVDLALVEYVMGA